MDTCWTRRCVVVQCGVATFGEDDGWSIIDEAVESESRLSDGVKRRVVEELREPFSREEYRAIVGSMTAGRLRGEMAMLGENISAGSTGPVLASELMRRYDS